jgi:hypothetical protein
MLELKLQNLDKLRDVKQDKAGQRIDQVVRMSVQ